MRAKGKMQETKMIEIDKETYERLSCSKTLLAKVLRKKSVSFTQLFKLFYVAVPLDVALQDMILEENPSVKFDKKPKKQETEDENDE
jgi:hypothetical protein